LNFWPKSSLEGDKKKSEPRIGCVDHATITDAAMLTGLDRCRREGTPRPERQSVRAHVLAVFWSFANSWRDR
jgi:hypothetical protein